MILLIREGENAHLLYAPSVFLDRQALYSSFQGDNITDARRKGTKFCMSETIILPVYLRIICLRVMPTGS